MNQGLIIFEDVIYQAEKQRIAEHAA
jgi:hypothetical protein